MDILTYLEFGEIVNLQEREEPRHQVSIDHSLNGWVALL
jgi:hypothetical protein